MIRSPYTFTTESRIDKRFHSADRLAEERRYARLDFDSRVQIQLEKRLIDEVSTRGCNFRRHTTASFHRSCEQLKAGSAAANLADSTWFFDFTLREGFTHLKKGVRNG